MLTNGLSIAAFVVVQSMGSLPDGASLRPASFAQPAETPKAMDNAATELLALFDAIPAPDRSKIESLDWKGIPDSPGASVTPEFAKVASAIPRAWAARVAAATRLPRCEFPIAKDEGPLALLPHLGKVRLLARALRVEARKQLLDGNVDVGADHAATLIRLGRLLSADRWVISSVVGMATVASGLMEAEACARSGGLSRARRDALLQDLKIISGADPFEVRAAVLAEKERTEKWVARFTGAAAGKEFLRALGVTEAEHTNIGALSGDDFQRAAAHSREFHTDLLAAWDAPDVRTRVPEVYRRLSEGQYGRLAKLLLSPPLGPDHSKLPQTCSKFAEEVKRAQASLEGAKVSDARR